MGCPEGLAKSVWAGIQKRKHDFSCNGCKCFFGPPCRELIPPPTLQPPTPNYLYQSPLRSCRELLNHLVARWGRRGGSSTPFSTSVYTCFCRLRQNLSRAPHTTPAWTVAVCIDRPRPARRTVSDFCSCLNSGPIVCRSLSLPFQHTNCQLFHPHTVPTLDQPIASRLLKASEVMMDGS
jgi:hypothetical protein